MFRKIIIIVLFMQLIALVAASIHPKPDEKSDVNNNTFVCGQSREFGDPSGTISSPGYPVRYPSNVICTYNIAVEWGLRIELKWKDFDIDGNMPDCDEAKSDYVEIFTGCGSSRKYLTRFCNKNSAKPHAIYSVDNCLSIQLVTKPTELAKVSKGFLASYTTVNRTKLLGNQKCNNTISDDNGIIHSTDWPHTYQNTTWDYCNWHIKVSGNYEVKFTIMDLDTYQAYYSQGSCSENLWYQHDSVIFQGIGSLYVSNQLWREFFGGCSPFAYQTPYSELVINWKKGPRYYYYYQKDRRGFIIGYVAYRPVNKSRIVAPWQTGLLVFAVVFAALFWSLFSCRHKKIRAALNGNRYGRLVHTSTDTDDLHAQREEPRNNVSVGTGTLHPNQTRELQRDHTEHRSRNFGANTVERHWNHGGARPREDGHPSRENLARSRDFRSTSCESLRGMTDTFNGNNSQERDPARPPDMMTIQNNSIGANSASMEDFANINISYDSISQASNVQNERSPLLPGNVALNSGAVMTSSIDVLFHPRPFSQKDSDNGSANVQFISDSDRAIIIARAQASSLDNLELPDQLENQGQESVAPTAPPAYDEIYNDQQALIHLVSEIANEISSTVS